MFSAGNGGLLNGTCSYDELISSIYTIGISVITGRNTMSLQNVKCAGIMAVTYGRDGMDGIDNTEFQMVQSLLVTNFCCFFCFLSQFSFSFLHAYLSLHTLVSFGCSASSI